MSLSANTIENCSSGTLSFELSGFGEKIITNCGASESLGKNPEYLRYSAAHSTIVLQNTNISEIKEDNPHKKFPQSVVFRKEAGHQTEIFEGSHNGYLKKFNKIMSLSYTFYVYVNSTTDFNNICTQKKTIKTTYNHKYQAFSS